MTASRASTVGEGLPAARGVRARYRAWLALPLLGPVLFLLVWSLLAVLLRNQTPLVVPKPWDVAMGFGRASQQGLGADIMASVKVAAGGWAVGGITALIVGIAIGRIRWLKEIVNPVIEVLRPVSALAWVPLAIVWFGIGYSSKLFIVGLATFFIAIVHVIQGAESIDSRHLKVAQMLALRRRDVYRFVIMPSAVPEILLGLRLGLGVAWGGVIIAELVAGDKGVGALELRAQQGFDLDMVVVGMVVFAILGLIAVLLFGAVERTLFPWVAAQREKQ